MKHRGIHSYPIVLQFLLEQNGFVCCLQVHSSSQCGMQHLPQVLQVQISGSWRSLRLPFSSPSGWGVCWHSVPPAGAFGGLCQIPAGGWQCSSCSHIHQHSQPCGSRTSDWRRNTFAFSGPSVLPLEEPTWFSKWFFGKEKSIMAVVLMQAGDTSVWGKWKVMMWAGNVWYQFQFCLLKLLHCWDLVFANRGGKSGDVKVKGVLSSSDLEMGQLRILRAGGRTKSRMTTWKKITVGKRSPFLFLGSFLAVLSFRRQIYLIQSC